MTPRTWPIAVPPRAARLAGLLTDSAFAALALLSPAGAQETPQPTGAEPTAGPTGAPGETVIRLEVDAPEEPVPVGDIIQATVLVDNVEHLAGFDFTITYDPDKLQLVEAEGDSSTPVPTVDPALGGTGATAIEIEQLGAFIEASARGERLFCQVPSAGDGQVVGNCSTAFAPACLGGPEGATGSGVLAVIPFESRGGGATSLEITSSTLVLDDVEPCDPVDGAPVAIPHTRGAAAPLELAPKDEGSSAMLIIIVVIVVVVVAVVGAGGFLAYRRYQVGQGGSS
jgi:hypothetical protein